MLGTPLRGNLAMLMARFNLGLSRRRGTIRAMLGGLTPRGYILVNSFGIAPSDTLLLPVQSQVVSATSLFTRPLLDFPSSGPSEGVSCVFIDHSLAMARTSVPGIITSSRHPRATILRFTWIQSVQG